MLLGKDASAKCLDVVVLTDGERIYLYGNRAKGANRPMGLRRIRAGKVRTPFPNPSVIQAGPFPVSNDGAMRRADVWSHPAFPALPAGTTQLMINPN